jgi:hypothetical protein
MLLALAALEAPLQLPLGDKGLYGEDCVFMANDWHASMVPVYLAAKYRAHGVYKNARSVMAIHNLRHQVGKQGGRALGVLSGAGRLTHRHTDRQAGRQASRPAGRQASMH